MDQINTGRQAAVYLSEHGYEEVRAGPQDPKTQVTFKKDTGDSTWERFTGPGNGWDEMGKGSCCYKTESIKPNSSFCGRCGNGVNKRVIHTKGDYDVGGGLGDAKISQAVDRLIEEVSLVAN